MLTTIDKAGRVVIPAEIRAKAHLKPGEPLEVDFDEEGGVRLRRKISGPKIVRVGKRLMAVPTVESKNLPVVDIAKLIDEERDRFPW